MYLCTHKIVAANACLNEGRIKKEIEQDFLKRKKARPLHNMDTISYSTSLLLPAPAAAVDADIAAAATTPCVHTVYQC